MCCLNKQGGLSMSLKCMKKFHVQNRTGNVEVAQSASEKVYVACRSYGERIDERCAQDVPAQRASCARTVVDNNEFYSE